MRHKPIFMPNLAAKIREQTQIAYPGATVYQRIRNGIVHSHPSDPNKFISDFVIGSMHYGPTQDQEIDTDWIDASLGGYRKAMIAADYNAYVGLDDPLNFDAGPVIKFVEPVSGLGITFQPQALQWQGGNGGLSQISIPQSVSGIVADNIIYWSGAYGSNLDFHTSGTIDLLVEIRDVDMIINEKDNPIIAVG